MDIKGMSRPISIFFMVTVGLKKEAVKAIAYSQYLVGGI